MGHVKCKYVFSNTVAFYISSYNSGERKVRQVWHGLALYKFSSCEFVPPSGVICSSRARSAPLRGQPRPKLPAAGVRGARAAQGLRLLRGTSAPAPCFPLVQVSKEVLSVLLISVPERCFLPLWLFSCKSNKNVKFSLLRAHRDFFDDSVTCLGRFLSL